MKLGASQAFGLAAAVVCIAGAAAIGWALAAGPGVALETHVPIDHPRRRAKVEKVNIEGAFKSFKAAPAQTGESWPRFRGPDFDNIVKDAVPLADHWPAGGPPVLWKLALGEGHAGAAVHRGRVYVLDYDEEAKADALRCFALADGSEIWRRAYKVKIPRYHGISRTVPAVTDKWIVTIGPKCQVMCVETETGAFKWGMDLATEYGTSVRLYPC